VKSEGNLSSSQLMLAAGRKRTADVNNT